VRGAWYHHADDGAPLSDRPHTILERYFSSAIVRGERVVAITRAVMTVLFLIEWIFFAGILGPAQGTPTYSFGISGMALGILYSTGTLLWLRAPHRLRVLLTVSVCIDAAIIGLIILPQVIWPQPGLPGILNAPDMALLLLAIIAAGVRLSRTVLLVGAGLMLALFGTVVTLMAVRPIDGVAFPANTTATWSLFLIGAAVLGYSIATRTRRLVFEGADTALVAERTRQRFGAYVSEEIAQEAIEAEEITLGGRRQPVAVLFSDLRGFTAYSERVPPEQLIAELNGYLNVMVGVIRREGGVVDKFIGDAIMVVFGIPKHKPDDARRAIRAAAGMQVALAEHNEERAKAGRAPFKQGIGVHFGPAVAGHVGTAERLQYTVVGDVVNVASRLESATKAMEVSVLISTAVAEAAAGDGCPQLKCRGRIKVPGHEQDLEVHMLG
jgi:class 3 adenylate cyclase